ncbi:class I SAM-dependent methyltransferase [Methylotuvimicrobium sp. KM1]|uniref:class I SAM-dependent methyltransferase n=1 Tax=Methylotuvimicrobium sp. KM1 TaxID=3377707 RepID=UPI0038516564
MPQTNNKKQTIDFYNANAEQYVAETSSLDVSDHRNRFLNFIPDGGHILDLGCGSGRDSRFFIDRGYSVTAVDASEAIAKLASEFIGKTVDVLAFQELDYFEAFDGIWACASLLHCPKSEMDSIIRRMTKALKPHGIVYMSFKYGADERVDELGRFFNDYTEADLSELLAAHSDLQIVDLFTETKPLRGSHQTWLNLYAKKQADNDV